MATTDRYRERVYASYASKFRGTTLTFDEGAAKRWARAQPYYLRGWLPQNYNSPILDVACGDGKLMYCLMCMGYKNVRGVDLSGEQITIARQVSSQVVQQDAITYLEKNQGTFELILGLDIIEHFKKNEALNFLDFCKKALVPGGRLVLQSPNANTPWGSQIRYADFTHENGFDPKALVRLLELVGFRGVLARELGPVPWGYSGKSTLRWILWQILRLYWKASTLVETGTCDNDVYTRVMMVSGVRPTDPEL